jgi:hypothetical protein
VSRYFKLLTSTCVYMCMFTSLNYMSIYFLIICYCWNISSVGGVMGPRVEDIDPNAGNNIQQLFSTQREVNIYLYMRCIIFIKIC